MELGGLQKTTLLDYPGKVACTVFFAGCNLRCPFCHNASLVVRPTPPQMAEEEFFTFLRKRRGILDGVCITGGEPTLRKDLPLFLGKIREMGFLVKLDTNGTNPEMLKALINHGLLDYVAMDIKGSPSRYAKVCGGIDVLESVKKSTALLLAGDVDYEFRTTCVHPFHDPDDMHEIGRWLRGAKQYYLQNFVDSGDLVGTGICGLKKEEMEELHQAVLPYIPNTRLRGI